MRRMYSKNQLKEIIDKNFTTPEEVEEILLDDKDVLKHLEYNEDDFIITFPKGVLPLRYYNEAQAKSGYFDYSSGKILDDSGVQIGQISWDDESIFAEYASDATPDEQNDQIEYMMFNGGNIDLSPEINGYNLYHPTKPIYIHPISIQNALASDAKKFKITCLIFNNDATPFTLETFKNWLDALYADVQENIRIMASGAYNNSSVGKIIIASYILKDINSYYISGILLDGSSDYTGGTWASLFPDGTTLNDGVNRIN